MEQSLAAVRKGSPDALALSHSSPVRGGSDRAVISGEPDEDGIGAIFLPRQLAYIQLAALAHLGRTCVSQVRIMRPDDDFRGSILTTDMRDECIERLDHVTVAQVPRRYVFEKHRAVVFFGVLDQFGILLGVEELILRDAAFSPPLFRRPSSHLDGLINHFTPA